MNFSRSPQSLLPIRAEWAVFPLHAIVRDTATGNARCGCGDVECKTVGKHPNAAYSRLAKGQQLTIAPGCGYGIATGERSGIWVLDVDNKDGRDGSATLSALEKGNGSLPETYTVGTPTGGYHFHFRCPPGFKVPTNAGKLGEGLDLRGEGGYAVGPGSPHRNGGVYAVLVDVEPADAPECLLDLVKGTARAVGAAPVSAVAIGPEHSEWEYRVSEATKFLAEQPPCVSGKGGQKQLWEIALRLSRTCELPVATSCELFADYNAGCQPPWEHWEYQRAFARAAEHGTGVTGLPSQHNPLFQKGPGLAKVRTDAADAHQAPDLPAIFHEEHPKESFERGDHAELAEELIRTHGSRLVTTEGAVWSYDAARGVWVEDGIENALRTRVVRFANMPAGGRSAPLRVDKHTVDGTLSIVKLLTEKKDFFTNAPTGLACANGFVTLTGLVRHAEENRARTYYPFAFEPDERSDAWEAFLHSLFRDDEDEAEKIACLQEFFGGALFGLSTRYQKCVIGTGSGSNGKSEFGKVIRGVFPDGSVKAVAPKKWEHDPSLATLRGALLNLVGDMPHGAIIDSAHFKEVIGGDAVTVDMKYKEPFLLRPICGHFFAANELPMTSDQTEGFWRRFIVVTYNRSFEVDPDRDPMIGDKLLATERAGIVAWLVAGARKLAARGKYTIPASHAEALETWKVEVDSVATFKAERLEEDPEGKGEKASALYGTYDGWAKLNGVKPVTHTRFGKRLKALGVNCKRDKKAVTYMVRCSKE